MGGREVLITQKETLTTTTEGEIYLLNLVAHTILSTLKRKKKKVKTQRKKACPSAQKKRERVAERRKSPPRALPLSSSHTS